MNFQCHDLDRALQSPELMPAALAHADSCPHCREQLELWNDISNLAPQLQQSWESPDLWPRIRSELIAAPPCRQPLRREPNNAWRWALATAAAFTLSVLLWQMWLGPPSPKHEASTRQAPSRELLTEEAFREVQQAEAAYTRSIEKLSSLAGPGLDRSTAPLAAAYREKLVVLDSAITDLKAASEGNRYNAYVQTQLASLYQVKQKTLQEWLENAKNN